jgi:hypothetical protein
MTYLSSYTGDQIDAAISAIRGIQSGESTFAGQTGRTITISTVVSADYHVDVTPLAESGFILTLGAIAHAETTVGVELIGQGAGYDTGYGLAVSHMTGRYADIFAAEAQTIRFLQAGEREQDTIFTVGIGWEF